jgi:hypothetical protein
VSSPAIGPDVRESVFKHLKLYGQPIDAKEFKHVDETLFYVQWVCLFLFYFKADVDSDG